MNPVAPRFILPSNAAAPAASGQASSSASAQVTVHPAALTMAHISENTMLALAQVKLQPNAHHQLSGSLAHEGMLDGMLLFQRTEGETAHFAQRVNISPEDGDATLQVSARRNERGEYDVESIGLYVHNIDVQESISLSVAPPPAQGAAESPASTLPVAAPVSKGNKAMIEDPENPGRMVLKQTYNDRLRARELVDDPLHPGKQVSRNTLSKRNRANRMVEDPLNPGQMIRAETLRQRQQVPDPNNPGQTISRSARSSRKYGTKRVDDPNRPGGKISQNGLSKRQLVADPQNPGELIPRNTKDIRNRNSKKK